MRRAITLLLRGLLLRCPYCGRPTLVGGLLRVHEYCRVCRLAFEHGEGFFLGALIVNYMVTALVGIAPAIVAVATGTWSVRGAIAYASVASLLFPILFFWHAKSLWMTIYYLFVPDDLIPRPEREAGPSVDMKSLTPEEQQRLHMEEALAALEGGRPGSRP